MDENTYLRDRVLALLHLDGKHPFLAHLVDLTIRAINCMAFGSKLECLKKAFVIGFNVPKMLSNILYKLWNNVVNSFWSFASDTDAETGFGSIRKALLNSRLFSLLRGTPLVASILKQWHHSQYLAEFTHEIEAMYSGHTSLIYQAFAIWLLRHVPFRLLSSITKMVAHLFWDKESAAVMVEKILTAERGMENIRDLVLYVLGAYQKLTWGRQVIELLFALAELLKCGASGTFSYLGFGTDSVGACCASGFLSHAKQVRHTDDKKDVGEGDGLWRRFVGGLMEHNQADKP